MSFTQPLFIICNFPSDNINGDAKAIGWVKCNPVIDDVVFDSNTWCYANLGMSFGFIQITQIPSQTSSFRMSNVQTVEDSRQQNNAQTTIDFNQNIPAILSLRVSLKKRKQTIKKNGTYGLPFVITSRDGISKKLWPSSGGKQCISSCITIIAPNRRLPLRNIFSEMFKFYSFELVWDSICEWLDWDAMLILYEFLIHFMLHWNKSWCFFFENPLKA